MAIMLDFDKCSRCKACQAECPVDGAIVYGNAGYPLFNNELCVECRACVDVCPENAIIIR